VVPPAGEVVLEVDAAIVDLDQWGQQAGDSWQSHVAATTCPQATVIETVVTVLATRTSPR
jgi:hypothetical protein